VINFAKSHVREKVKRRFGSFSGKTRGVVCRGREKRGGVKEKRSQEEKNVINGSHCLGRLAEGGLEDNSTAWFTPSERGEVGEKFSNGGSRREWEL